MRVRVRDHEVDPSLARVVSMKILGKLGLNHDHAPIMLYGGGPDLLVVPCLEDQRLESEGGLEVGE